MKIESLTVNQYSLSETGLSQSLVQSFAQCPRKFLYKINRWRKQKNQPNTLFGTIVHDILDKIYSSGDFSINEIDTWIDEVLTKEKQLNEFGELQAAKAFAVLTEYLDYYKNDMNENKYGKPEEKFCIESGKNDIHAKRLGKIDGQFCPKKSKKLWLLERKTMSRIDEDTLMLYLNFDFQSLFYTTGKEDLNNVEIHGVLYDIIRNPGSKPKKNESLIDYVERIQKEIREKPEYYFIRMEIPFSKEDKIVFRNELSRKVKDIFFKLEACKKANASEVFYRNQSSCKGLFACEYLQACSTGLLNEYEQIDSIFPELE